MTTLQPFPYDDEPEAAPLPSRAKAAAISGLLFGIKWCVVALVAMIFTLLVFGFTTQWQILSQRAYNGQAAWEFIDAMNKRQAAQQASAPGVPIEKLLPPGATATVEDVPPPAGK